MLILTFPAPTAFPGVHPGASVTSLNLFLCLQKGQELPSPKDVMKHPSEDMCEVPTPPCG